MRRPYVEELELKLHSEAVSASDLSEGLPMEAQDQDEVVLKLDPERESVSEALAMLPTSS